MLPATSSLLSRLPACRPGGLLLTRPSSGAGATPMLPKNGLSGMTMPGMNSAVIVVRSSVMIFDRTRPIAVLRDEAAAAVVAVVDRQVDRQHLHLEHVARLRAFDIDRTGQNVPARSAPIAGHFGDDRPERALNALRRTPARLQAVRRVGEQRVDVDDVARGDSQNRLAPRSSSSRTRRWRASPRGGASSERDVWPLTTVTPTMRIAAPESRSDA